MVDREFVVRFILNRKYFLKLYRVPKSTWRKKIADEFVGLHKEYGSLFCAIWEELEGGGLI